MGDRKKILIAPLDWGLGHATRCTPIIAALKDEFDIILAASGRSKQYLHQTFPTIPIVSSPGYGIRYPKGKNMTRRMLLQAPKILHRIKQEQQEAEALVKKHQIDLILSDNRFGFYSKNVPSIYLTHQLRIQAKHQWVRDELYRRHRRCIQQFSRCWIPDTAFQHYAGKLSRSNGEKGYQFIGPLSRFQSIQVEKKAFDYCLLLSGPEPSRTQLEQLLIGFFTNTTNNVVLFRGTPGEPTMPPPKNVTVYPHASTEEMAEIISHSKVVISRPGYSTIMDLATLQIPCLFIPTPGQTEQEYLARYHKQRNGISWIDQNKLTLQQIEQVIKKPLPLIKENSFDFVSAIKEWL